MGLRRGAPTGRAPSWQLCWCWRLRAAPASRARRAAGAAQAAFGEALKNWAAAHKIKRAFVIVRRDGRVVYTSALGRRDAGHAGAPRQPVEGDHRRLRRNPGARRQARLRHAGVSVALREIHRRARAAARSAPGRGDGGAAPHPPRGLRRRRRRRSGERPQPRSPISRATARGSRPKPSLLAATLRARLAHAPGARYAYGNAAYLVLGAIIEEASRQALSRPIAARRCSRRSVSRAISSRPGASPPSMGGWRMTGEDYLHSSTCSRADDTRLGAAAKAWMVDPHGKSRPVRPVRLVWARHARAKGRARRRRVALGLVGLHARQGREGDGAHELRRPRRRVSPTAPRGSSTPSRAWRKVRRARRSPMALSNAYRSVKKMGLSRRYR